MRTARRPSSIYCSLLIALSLVPASATAQIVTAPGPGHSPAVRVLEIDGRDRTFLAYHPSFLGGVRVALGDVNADGVLDIITGAGPGGGPHVRVWNGVDHTEIGGFFAYHPAFAGGVWVAAGDVDGDGHADIITGAGRGGGPHVRVWSGADFREIGGFFAYHPAFPGGVRVAAGDVNGDGLADIITGAGPGGGPHVRVWNGAGFAEIGGFFAYTPSFAGGVFVAAGDVDGDGLADIITGPGAGGSPNIRIRSGASFALIGSFQAYYDPAFTGGITVGAVDLTRDRRVEIIAGAGPGAFPITSIFDGATLTVMGSYFAYDPSFTGGVFIGSVGGANPLRFSSANNTAFTVGSAGTFAVTTTGAGSRTLSVTGTLPGGVTFTDNGDGTGTLAGTPDPGTAGAYNVTFTATPSTGTPVTQSFTLTVRLGPAITSANATTFNIGGSGTFTITTTGVPSPAISVTGTLPSGLTFTDNGNGTGTIAGVAASGTAGTYPLVITATNGVGSPATQNFTLTIQQGAVITSANAVTFTVGAPGTFTITTIGSPTATSILRTGVLPSGVTFTNNGDGTATLAGVPGAGTGGTYPLTITANNGVGSPAVQSFTLTVNQPPAITSATSTAFTVGTPGSFTVTTTGLPTATLSTASTLPTGVTFVDNGNGTAMIAGTPGAGTGGTYPLTISATNGVGSPASQGFTLTVQEAPAIGSANSATFTVGAPGTFTVTTTGFPVASIVRGGGALPTGVTFVDNGNGTGTLSGTPAMGTDGAYALTFTATNGVGSAAVQNFTLNVQQAPAITSAASTTFTIGTPSTFTVTTTGFPAPDLAAGGAALPTGVTFVDNDNGTATLSGTPAAGTAGPYALTFTASNAVGTPAVQNFTLTVACPSITLTPAAGALTAGVYLQSYSQTFTAIGGSGHTFAITAGALPSGLTLGAGGALTGSPTTTGAFSFTVTATDSSGCTGSAAYSLSVTPNAIDESFSGGVGNTQYVVAPSPTSSTPAVLVSGTVLSNDVGPGALSVGPAGITSTNGGAVALATNGAFVYTPAIGFAGPADTFVYTLTDGNGITDTATVTINLSGVVWYVNNSGGNGDGRSHNPFNNVTSAQAPSGNGQVIYVHTGSGTTTGTIVLKPSQTLWGAGATFTSNSLTIPFTGTPTLSGTVTLANDVLLNAFNISGSAGAAITGTGVGGSVAINNVNVLGGSSGINLTTFNGTLTFQFSAVSGVTPGASFLLSGGTGSVSGRLGITSTVGRSIDIQGKTGGTINFGGTITDSGSGIFLNSNTGATIGFTGGLTLSTGANAAFTATGGGTVTASQNNVTVVNTIATTTGMALNVANTTIGAAGLTFRSISANGGTNGIVLNNTGAGSFTVSGNVAAGSGGTINASTDAGISLSSTGSVNLSYMNVQNGGDDGIRGAVVNGFNLTNVTISSNGNAVGERGIDMTELTGSGSMSSVTVSGSAEANVRIANTTGTLSAFNVTNSSFTNTSIVTGDDGFLVEQNGTGAMTVSITGSTFTDNKGDHFQVASQTSAAGSIAFTFNNNTLTTTALNDPNVIGGGITISPSGSTDVTFTISNNDIQQAFDDGINLNLGTASTSAASLVGTISNNTIGSAGAIDSGSESSNGITVTSNGAGVTTVAITDNQVFQYANAYGIFLNNKEGSSALNATVTGNTVSNPGTFAINGIRVDAGATSGPPPDTGFVCVAMTGNSVANSGLLTDDIRLRQRFATTIQLPGYTGADNDTAAVNAFVQANNGGAGTDVSSAHNVGGGGFGFIGGSGCIQP